MQHLNSVNSVQLLNQPPPVAARRLVREPPSVSADWTVAVVVVVVPSGPVSAAGDGSRR